MRPLLTCVPQEAAPAVLRYGWQAAAALYAAFGTAPPVEPREVHVDRDELIDQAVATGDEHAIKFTEACLREYVLDPQPVYLAAAEHAAGVLRRP
jgi:hypothetical protein